MTAREWQHALYMRDRWTPSAKLTLDLGMRYESIRSCTGLMAAVSIGSICPIPISNASWTCSSPEGATTLRTTA